MTQFDINLSNQSFSDDTNFSIQYNEKRRLSDNFQPGCFDVICGRGRKALEHPGNQRYRRLVEKFVGKYAAAETKNEKSKIVMLIVNSIRRSATKMNGDGGFVRQDSNKIWYEVGDQYAREKCGQTFRDLLFTEYKSSTKAKAISRRARVQIKKGNEKRRHNTTRDHYYDSNTLQKEPCSWIHGVLDLHHEVSNQNICHASYTHESGEASGSSSLICVEPQKSSLNNQDLQALEIFNESSMKQLYQIKQLFDERHEIALHQMTLKDFSNVYL